MQVFLYNKDLFPIICVCIAFMLFSIAHQVLFPRIYMSIINFIYHGDLKKTVRSSAMRCLYVILFTIIFYRYFKFEGKQIYLGILLSCLLTVWPAIVQYRLLKFVKSKEKSIILMGYILFTLMSIFTSYIAIEYISSMIFEGKEYFLVENSGFELIKTLVLIIAPISIEGFLAKYSSVATLDIETYREEIYILTNQLQLESYIVELYKYEIDLICKKYNISVELLKTILKLEYINRGRWYISILERLACKYFPSIAIKKDISVGIAQIKISTAKDILKQSPTKFIRKLVEVEFNLDVCAKLLQGFIKDYNTDDNDEWIKENCQDIYEYIANKYLSSSYTDSNKTVLVYSSILRSSARNNLYYEERLQD